MGQPRERAIVLVVLFHFSTEAFVAVNRINRIKYRRYYVFHETPVGDARKRRSLSFRERKNEAV